jgi:hypothetical protein
MGDPPAGEDSDAMSCLLFRSDALQVPDILLHSSPCLEKKQAMLPSLWLGKRARPHMTDSLTALLHMTSGIVKSPVQESVDAQVPVTGLAAPPGLASLAAYTHAR